MASPLQMRGSARIKSTTFDIGLSVASSMPRLRYRFESIGTRDGRTQTDYSMLKTLA